MNIRIPSISSYLNTYNEIKEYIRRMAQQTVESKKGGNQKKPKQPKAPPAPPPKTKGKGGKKR